ncbi:DUF2484 family protein [Palleronia sp. KMU-117]|uniref:DUF2484 family protein n=1 Tax=Palleronia sp. KMU-117 TaxID=3434108 RepID=UPI003D7075E3
MTAPVVLGLVWLVLANVIGMFPSRHQHWPAAYGLIAVGIPLLGWITYLSGPWVGLIFLAAGASVLRWPVRYLLRWLRTAVLRSEG